MFPKTSCAGVPNLAKRCHTKTRVTVCYMINYIKVLFLFGIPFKLENTNLIKKPIATSSVPCILNKIGILKCLSVFILRCTSCAAY